MGGIGFGNLKEFTSNNFCSILKDFNAMSNSYVYFLSWNLKRI